MVTAYLGLLLLLALERILELVVSRRHIRWALEQGGRELGREHFGFMTILHVSFLVACAAEVVALKRPFYPLLGWPMLGLALAAQALRYWSIFALGRFWSVRVVVVPGSSPVTRGPYRYIRHPNYLAVIIEGLAVPLIHAAWITAAAFSALNGLLLRVRIRCEEAALCEHCSYGERFRDRPRFLPMPWRVGRS